MACRSLAPSPGVLKDAALMLDVLGGTRDFQKVGPPGARLRVAVSTKSPSFLTKPAPEVVAAVRETAAILKDAGHSITEADPPYPNTLANAIMRLWTAGVAQDAQKLNWSSLEPRTRTMARIGRLLGPSPRKVMQRWATKASTWFGDFDVALMPAVARSSIPAGGWTGRGFVSTALEQIKALPFNAPWNVAGFPAASVPSGIGPEGIPLSVQLVAPAQRESVILELALQLESVRPWQPAPSG